MSRSERTRQCLWMAPLGLILSCAGGCAVGEATPQLVRNHTTLVLPPPKLSTHWDVPPYEDTWDWGWEYRRNDDAAGIGGSSGLEVTQEIEEYVLDRRATRNGRVTESSSTTTRTLRRGWVSSPYSSP